MAPSKDSDPKATEKAKSKKLPRLPKNARIQKRPILHPPIPSPFVGADQPKVVYISANTPFVSAVKRVRKLLTQVEKRAVGKVDLVDGKGSDKQKLKKLAEKAATPQSKEPEAVFLKATGRAVKNMLGIALYFQGQDDCNVKLNYGELEVVDDIIHEPVPTGSDGDNDANKEKEEELPESRLRKLNYVEAAITLK